MNEKERIENMICASKMISKAADLIEKSLHMSGIGIRFNSLPARIRSLNTEDDGIINLIREFEYSDEEQPGWTRPLVSNKNLTRKDI